MLRAHAAPLQYYLSRYDSEEEAHAVVRRALKEVMVSLVGKLHISRCIERVKSYFGVAMVVCPLMQGGGVYSSCPLVRGGGIGRMYVTPM